MLVRQQSGRWYNLTSDTNEQILVTEVRKNIEDIILPYFERINSREKLLSGLNKEQQILLELPE